MQASTATSAQRHDEYYFDHFADNCRAYFAKVIAEYGPHLFTVDVGDHDLYASYLDSLPSQDRQHHTCHCCKQFIERYGNLAAIAPDGRLIPAIWDVVGADDLYADAVSAMYRAVAAGKVTGVFLASSPVWGTPVTGTWTHFSIDVPVELRYRRGTLTAGQAMAAKREDYGTLQRGLAEYNRNAVAQALTLLESEALYRSEKVVGPARFLLELHDARAKAHGRQRENVTWLAVAKAPAGFCTPRSSMVGTLLDDIVAGKSFADVKRSFADKMQPERYQRPTAAPSSGNIAQAEKLVEQMGIKASLRRRYARLEDLRTIWTPQPLPFAPAPSGGVFTHLQPSGRAPTAPPMRTAAIPITWSKFARTVIPNALKIEVYAAHQALQLVGLVTATDPAAPPILQWDRDEDRNPVSWYVYNHGSSPEEWSLRSGSWVPVTAITLQPSMWAGEEAFPHHGKSAILVLEGAKDKRSPNLALFPEILRTELHAIRSTIEAFSKAGEIEGAAEASANGLRVGGDGASPAIRVTTSIGAATYSIDRWE